MPQPDRAHLLETLAEGVSALTDSERWRRHLDVQARFHTYSFGNVLLIAAQRPDASRVAGFSTWKGLGRSVRRGERAIWILAPVRRRRDPGDRDDDSHRDLCGFRPVAVFDVSQTEGDALPEVCDRLEGPDPGALFERLAARAGAAGYTVVPAELPGSTNGDCTFALRRIRVEVRNPPAQRVKTLAHELAHALLHEGATDRALAELEAESAAYVVCGALGIDSGAYSFGYLVTWAGGGGEAVAALKGSAARIQHAAATILDGPGSAYPSEPAVRARSKDRSISSQAASTPSNPPTLVSLSGSRSL